MYKIVAMLLTLCLLVAACGSQTKSTGPQAGQWAGKDISFEVTTDSRIRNLQLTTKLASGSTCRLFSEGDIAIVEDGSFSAHGTFKGDSGKAADVNQITGSFSSGTAASGSYGPMIVCGDESTYWLKAPEWTAEWKGQ